LCTVRHVLRHNSIGLGVWSVFAFIQSKFIGLSALKHMKSGV